MALFAAEYADARTSIVMKADLVNGVCVKNGKMKFVGSTYLPYKGETSFRCQLHVTFETHDERRLAEAMLLANYSWIASKCSIFLELGRLRIACPIQSQNFLPSNLKSHNPVSYFDESLDLVTPDRETVNHLGIQRVSLWSPNALIQYWIAIHGPSSMFVADRREEFESTKVVSGGRPESNRSRF